MKDLKLRDTLRSIFRNGGLPRCDVVRGDIPEIERQAMTSYLVNHNLATIDGNKWRLTDNGLNTLRGES